MHWSFFVNLKRSIKMGKPNKGFFLVKDDKFRYEYNSQNLYTILHNQNIFFLIENRDTTKFLKIDKDTEVLEAILKIINDYPDFKNNYYLDESLIKLEFTSDNFIKRIALLSDKINLSVYVNDCEFFTIKNMYFSYSPFFKYIHYDD